MPRRSSSIVPQTAPQAALSHAIRQAVAMQRGGWLAEAEKIYADVLKVAPGHFDALCLLGQLYQRYGRPADALRVIEKALVIAPHHPALLRARVAAREQLDAMTPHVALPLWRGGGNLAARKTDFAGRTVLLQAGEDIGQTLQFMRYAGILAQQGACVLLAVQESLRRLAVSSFPDMRVIARGEALPPFDVRIGLHADLQAALSDLPQPHESMPGARSWHGPYLEPSVELIAAWARELPSPKKLRIGLAWFDPSKQSNDTLCLPALEPVLSLPQIVFIGLQPVGQDGAADVVAQHAAIMRLQRPFSDFADLAAVVAQLDGVLACDMPVVHLAGAMGKPVLLLLTHNSDWPAATHGRADGSWYPTVQLYRQHRSGDWSAAIEAARQELVHRAP